MSDPSHIEVGGEQIAYRMRAGASPCLLFLPGYASDMEGAKATALDQLAEKRGVAMLRLDYSGTGLSSGQFEEGTLASWLEQALAALDRLTQGRLILVGSSMGGWLALHLARLRPERVQAIVGIAAAPDFTDWGFTEEQKESVLERGRLELPNPYGPQAQLFTLDFMESGQRLRLLGSEIPIDCPVRLIHGEADREVPLDVAFRLMRHLRSSDVQLNVLKGGGHRLSEPNEILAILRTVEALLEP